MDRILTLEAVRLTESAALYASRFMGKGDEIISYKSAAEAMAKVLAGMNIDGVIVNAGGEDAGNLVDGACVGNKNGPEVDMIVKPLDGKRTCARGGYNSISAVAISDKGAFMKVPLAYMEKIAVGNDAKGVIDITQPVEINIKRVARAKGKYIEDLTVCILDRDRNKKFIDDIRKTGAKISFITDGDISGAVSTAFTNNSIDILMGSGGAKEGILAAAALKCLDGDMQARFVYTGEKEKEYITGFIGDPDMILTISDMVNGDDLMVSFTGVTEGVLLPGVRYFSGGAETSSILLRQKTHTLRYINAIHHFDYKPIF